MRTAICIPTYKNRLPKLLSDLTNVSSDYDIYIFTSNNDYYESGYDKIIIERDVNWVSVDCTNLGQKLEYIRNYTIDKNYDKIFIVEDDTKWEGWKITPETKRTTSDSYKRIKVDINEMLDVMLKESENHNACLTAVDFGDRLGLSKPFQVAVNSRLTNLGHFVLLDLKKIQEGDIHYDITDNTIWDFDLALQIILKDYTCITVKYYGLSCVDARVDSTLGEMHKPLLPLRLYIKYRDAGSLFISRNGRMSFRINNFLKFRENKIVIKDDEYHQKLYELCKALDYEGVRNLIIENKKK